MKLQPKLLLSFGLALTVAFSLVEAIGYYQTHARVLVELRQNAREIRNILKASRQIYHYQPLASEAPLNEKTSSFLPKYSLSRISEDFLNWSESGLTFNSVSDRPRNQKNQADEVELEAMAYFRANPKEEERLVPFEGVDGQTYYHFSSPIWIEPYCLLCHGERETAPQSIRDLYDTAFGYKLGELRGLMSIKLPSSFIKEGVLAQRLKDMWRQFAAMLFAFAFGAFLLRRLVLRRLAMIGSVVGDLAKGDYAARVPVLGQDELSALAMAFNDMAEERQQAELSRRESEQQVRDLLDSTAEAIFGLDTEGCGTTVNPACVRMLGYQDAKQLIGKQFHSLCHHTSVDGTPLPIDECSITGAWRDGHATYKIEDVFWRLDGSSFPVELSSYPIRRKGELMGAVLTFVDITERLKSEESLRHAQKMEAIGQLTGGIAHDFNNLLGIMIGNLDLLEYQVSDNEEASKRVQTMITTALRAADLTRQLLGFSRRETKNIASTDVNRLLQGIGGLIVRSVTPEVELEFQLADALWLIDTDHGDLEDALLNLVINARDAMPNGGKLTIETCNRVLDAIYEAQNPIVAQGDYVELAVSDNGTGIPAEMLGHIYEPFFTTKSEGEGTGLGLSMVYGFVRRANGYIKAYSEVGIGTTFHIYLPRSEHQVLPTPPRGTGKEKFPGGDETILVVDDEVDLLALARDSLEALGYRTIGAETGEDALRKLAENEQIALLFSDVVMPGGMNGYELLGQATARWPNLKVLLTSGYTKKAIARNHQEQFDAIMLSKPYRREELAREVRKALDAGET